MTATDLLLALARCNAATSIAVLGVLVLRPVLRRCFGAQRAYAIWLTVPVAAAGSLLPARMASGAAGPIERMNDQLLSWLSSGRLVEALTTLWLIGVVGAAAITALRHARFSAAVRLGHAGPAAVGVVRPRLVTPSDYAERFTAEERQLVRAHERAHMDRLDPRSNAAAMLASWLFWFNPFIHLAAGALRLDQELACDAAVVDGASVSRRRYAETLLRTQHRGAPAVLGCQWSSRASQALEQRIRVLQLAAPSQKRRDIGLAVIVAAAAAALCGAWLAQPPARSPAPLLITRVDLVPPDRADARLSAAVTRVLASERATARAPSR